ncbi:hypothetical protein CYMTET_32026, partial [Cymbomonas tetramitiformis]
NAGHPMLTPPESPMAEQSERGGGASTRDMEEESAEASEGSPSSALVEPGQARRDIAKQRMQQRLGSILAVARILPREIRREVERELRDEVNKLEGVGLENTPEGLTKSRFLSSRKKRILAIKLMAVAFLVTLLKRVQDLRSSEHLCQILGLPFTKLHLFLPLSEMKTLCAASDSMISLLTSSSLPISASKPADSPTPKPSHNVSQANLFYSTASAVCESFTDAPAPPKSLKDGKRQGLISARTGAQHLVADKRGEEAGPDAVAAGGSPAGKPNSKRQGVINANANLKARSAHRLTPSPVNDGANLQDASASAKQVIPVGKANSQRKRRGGLMYEEERVTLEVTSDQTQHRCSMTSIEHLSMRGHIESRKTTHSEMMDRIRDDWEDSIRPPIERMIGTSLVLAFLDLHTIIAPEQ